jgi:hypothetical protein
VLRRYRLALVAEVAGSGFALLGEASPLERRMWAAIELAGKAGVEELADRLATPASLTRAALDGLAERRVLLRGEGGEHFHSLTSLVRTN